jgi:hypothetical protein
MKTPPFCPMLIFTIKIEVAFPRERIVHSWLCQIGSLEEGDKII